MSWLSRCFIINGSPERAWELYKKDEGTDDAFVLLQLIANECYRMGHFQVAAKAFNVLEKADPDPDFWEGKRGACMGVFQGVISFKQRHSALFSIEQHENSLNEVIATLKNSENPQAEFMCKVIRKWGTENEMKLQ